MTALELRQDGVSMASGWRQNGGRMVLAYVRIAVRMPSG